MWLDGGRFDGWSEHFSFDRWMSAAATAFADQPVDVDWYTTRERDRAEVLPWDHLDSGLDKDWLWQDWQDSLSDVEVEDCRWTPCFDCGVCDTMGTDIQIGPTGRTLLPLRCCRRSGMGRQPDARDVAPAVQRLRVHFAKRGRLRFTSHRDFQRVFERAIRRADVPVAFSAGFSPHPKISYVGAASTGAASEAEYLEIAVTRVCDPAQVRAELDAALPPGFDVIEVLEARGGSLPERIDTSHWQVTLNGVDPRDAARAVAAFLQAESIPVERVLKDGRRTLDARLPVVRLGVVGDLEATGCAILEMVVRHLTPAVRPDDVLAGLRQVSDLAPPLPPLVLRLAQGHLDEFGKLADPLAPDRDAAAGADPAVGIPATR